MRSVRLCLTNIINIVVKFIISIILTRTSCLTASLGGEGSSVIRSILSCRWGLYGDFGEDCGYCCDDCVLNLNVDNEDKCNNNDEGDEH